ncbi:hypothetical protein BHE74_00026786 [Ensete ventricosum]|nr:hypothetical protein BHE74_00026786 [Ensete ventricosum]
MIAFVAPTESSVVGLICLGIRSFLCHFRCSCSCAGAHDAISTIIARVVPRHAVTSNERLLRWKLPLFGPPWIFLSYRHFIIALVVWISSLQEGSQPSGPPVASRDLVRMRAAYNCSSVVTPRQLEELCTHFRVPTEVILSVPRGEDHPYHTFYGGFCLSIDALEVWLHLPSPLVAVAFLAF